MRRKPGPALRWGGIFGGAAAALVVVHALLADLVLDPTIAMTILSGAGFFLIYLVLFFMAGALASRETGLVRTGTLAGLFASIVSGGVSALAGTFDLVRQPLQDPPPPDGAISPGHYYTVLALITIAVALVVLLIFTGFGAGFGALGGVAGRPVIPARVVSAPSAQEHVPPILPPLVSPPATETETVPARMPGNPDTESADGDAAAAPSTIQADSLAMEERRAEGE